MSGFSIDMSFTLQVASVWGALLSTVLGGLKIWEMFWKDRVRLYSTYNLTGPGGPDSTVTTANLTPLPVMVRGWSLVWEPRALRFWAKSNDVTPYEARGFMVKGHTTFEMSFDEETRFAWDWKTAKHRDLGV